ncbi:organic solute transporter Ostalpha-domain-containing protein [Exophiala viscosa]|uniref:Organic solute transporter Ostalpha-domain-containing protein n=2 Tax=Exophiala viscosa TaxID=2486360 RepID=A0AAN6DWU8_9EURO|nr:organic solute transporter Ostalpha-domain-containing protein [Exophiala viscosa]
MGILSHSGGNSTCPAEPANANAKGVPVAGSLTFQHLMQIIGWVCFGVTALLSLGLMIPHFLHYRVPNEQRQIIRIILLPVVYSLVYAVSLQTYSGAQYLEPIAALYEAVALASLFLLYVDFVAPGAGTRDEFFSKLENTKKKGRLVPGGSLKWFRRTWRIVFFYLVAYTILIVAQEITQAVGVYCATSMKPRFAHVWLQVFELGSTIIAIINVIRFQRRLKHHMVGRKALPKLLSFKLFVAVTTIQHFVFSILSSHVSGNSKVTYHDITIGIQALLVCIESLINVVSFYFVFRASEYKHSQKEDGASLTVYGPAGALLNSLNPTDLLRGIILAFGGFAKV